LRLGTERTLFQISVERLAGLIPPDRILVVTVAEQAEELKKQVTEIPAENYLLEPMPRGTASVVGLAAVAIAQHSPDAIMAVLTADHIIENVEYFQKLLKTAYKVAAKGYLVTLGIEPTYAATGYGYIQRGKRLDDIQGQSVYQVERFKEKPDLTTAQAMIDQGDHDWNSGMFVWKVDRIQSEIHRLIPDLADSLVKIKDKWATDQRSTIIKSLWPQIKPQTIDYGIMERAENVAVLPAAGLGWNDIGSWDALFDVLPGDENGNIILDVKHLGLDTHESIILSDQKDRLIATIGVRDLIIIDTGKVLMVCNRNDAQKVRDIVQKLKQTDEIHYL
jgi:mannose-1-phosphate guanylyltransferase